MKKHTHDFIVDASVLLHRDGHSGNNIALVASLSNELDVVHNLLVSALA